jgi:hypothetical protein
MSLKVLIISRNAWTNENNNTLTNFFQNFSQKELANIYCREEIPNNELCKRFFKISESDQIKAVFGKTKYAGMIVDAELIIHNENVLIDADREKKGYDFFRHFRWYIFLWLRELIWKFGKWKSPALGNFIKDFKPDVIFTSSFDTFYTYAVLKHVQSIAKVPFVLFHCDDWVTFRQFSLSPFYWINRFFLWKTVGWAIKHAALNYCIIDKQKKVYEKNFKNDFKILNKCSDFSMAFTQKVIEKPVRIVYAGNIYYGRWQTLVAIGAAIHQINRGDNILTLDIYTSNPLSKKMKKRANSLQGFSLNGYKPYNEIIEIQKQADILLHVESFSLQKKLLTGLSFSTKLVDYFSLGKCILAIGWKNSASIEYLKKHDAALIISDLKIIETKLVELMNDQNQILKYSEKAYLCGNTYHEKAFVLARFRNDLIAVKNSKAK